MIGDLPEADSKPPTNMLFVCKLNQVHCPRLLPRPTMPCCPPLPVRLRTRHPCKTFWPAPLVLPTLAPP